MSGNLSFLFSLGSMSSLVVGTMVLTSGCETVDEPPMPPGAYQEIPLPTPDPDSSAPVAASPKTSIVDTPAVPNNGENYQDDVIPNIVVPPSVPVTPAPPAAPVKYKVQKGDSLSKIAKNYGVTVDALCDYNNITRRNYIQVGQTLSIPPFGHKVSVHTPKKATVKPSSTSKKISDPAASAGKTAKKREYQPIPADGIHVVQKNDSFYKIAARYGVKGADIAAANNLSLDSVLQLGQKLVIPQPGTKVTSAASDLSVKTSDKKASDTGKTASEAGTNEGVEMINIEEEIKLPEETSPIASSAAVEVVSDQPAAAPVQPVDKNDFFFTPTSDTTLTSIAEKYECNAAELKKLNPQLTESVKAGSKVKLPMPQVPDL